MSTPVPNKTPQEQLVAAINRLHNVELTTANVRFGVPELVDTVVNDLSDPTRRNSRVQILNAVTEPYEFSSTLHFNRLSLETVFGARKTSFSGEITHTHDLLPQLSERLGFSVSAEDIVGHPVDASNGYPMTLLLIAATSSLLLYGQVNVTLTGP